ncbi:MAG: restriction endonuclease subunit S [Gammaproteobacteria bacterium]|nr:restriction endonuclease subunit S [Gammaproteobacteria bacterium]MBU1476846.1 restriction endonuclease subunit S [Gammaproteobacteria bacterium]MBU2003395.1 restriction endonuclease subunit S [Gammaproteobacteria bacterium]MBU2131167.1 restriction endonuclease subunit S [Gammaproteobacteria bacterium]MBU2189724.1 restriction endonuclease subunit S [Gammaproteobacteria bacterium]
MSNLFRTHQLGEVAEIIAGGDKPKVFSLEKKASVCVPVLANAEKNNGLMGYTDNARIFEPAVTVAARGSNVGFVAVRKEPFFPVVRLLSLIPKKDCLDVDYLFYNLKQNRKTGTGSGQPQITIPDISSKTIALPPISIQKKIAEVLSILDKKIELNNRINAELESIAKTLYDYWFVQFDFPDDSPQGQGKPYKTAGGEMVYNPTLKREIPEGWEAGTLEDLGQIVGGSTPSTLNPENFTTKGTPWITPNDLSNNQGNKFVSRGGQDVSTAGIKSASLKEYPAGTVLLSSRAPIGYMAIARNNLTTNQGFKSFIPSKGYSSEFIYYTVKNSLKAITQYASGSTFKEVSGATLKTVKVVLPKMAVSDAFRNRIQPIFSKQDVIERESAQLAQLRDWLLPILMNGQVTVK